MLFRILCRCYSLFDVKLFSACHPHKSSKDSLKRTGLLQIGMIIGGGGGGGERGGGSDVGSIWQGFSIFGKKFGKKLIRTCKMLISAFFKHWLHENRFFTR